MIKKGLLILLLVFVTAFANEFLVRVDLTQDRLEPLLNENLKVLAELENSAILLVGNSDFDKISSYTHQILDQEPQSGEYYLVRLINPEVDLSKYGEILTSDNNDYLIKVNQGMLEPLIKEKVMIKRLTLKPIITKNAVGTYQFIYNPTIQEIVDKVSADSVLGSVQRLQDFVSRYSTYDSCFAAADWIASKFIAYGCDSVFFQSYDPSHAPNVVGIKRGVVHPDNIYAVVCGHFDATSYLTPDVAPGADDNASGTTGAIEAARVMKDYQFDYSVRYIAFSGEEFGLLGSAYYANEAYFQGDSILGVLNGDMIAYVDVLPESLEVIAKISNPACGPFADFFMAAADTYTTLLTRKNMVDWAPYSDHSPFWDNGYLALCLIEDMWPVNPYYHEPGDTIGAGYNDNAFCTEVIKAEVAALSILAEPNESSITDYGRLKIENRQLEVTPTVMRFSATINFLADGDEPALSLNIYSESGQLIRSYPITGANAYQPLFGQVVWDATDKTGHKVPAGIYFVELTTTKSRAFEKLIVLK